MGQVLGFGAKNLFSSPGFGLLKDVTGLDVEKQVDKAAGKVLGKGGEEDYQKYKKKSNNGSYGFFSNPPW